MKGRNMTKSKRAVRRSSEITQLSLAFLSTLFFTLVFASSAAAYPTYDDCATCHGSFPGGSNYTSLVDATEWGKGLMDGHLDFLGGRCSACHGPVGQSGVFLNQSDGVNYSQGCVGCHGRHEDVTNSCTGLNGTLGGVEVNCGSGAGLRAVHESKVGAGTCTDCHTNDGAPVGEHVLPYNYTLGNNTQKDSCDSDGLESQYGSTGLDNDGDGLRDADDPDCIASTFVINAGLNDAWVSADAAFQGLFFTVFEDIGLFFLSWFTFDSVAPDPGATAVFGAADQRWVTGAGNYSGDSVTLNVELTSGGIFNAAEPAATQSPGYGTITIRFISCNEAILTYNFPSVGLSGEMTLTRVVPDNVALCEAMSEG
jgi:hypothetical protein